MANDLLAGIRDDDNYYEELYPDFWIMDNHRWAFLAWEISAQKGKEDTRYSLIHADYHWDGINDFRNETDIARLLALTETNALKKEVRANQYIKHDSFIAPAVIRGRLKSLHFYCLPDEDDRGIDDSLLRFFGCQQFLHETVESLVNANVSSPIIFDLCLDLFYRPDRSGLGERWVEVEIIDFLHKTSSYIRDAKIVTVSLSYYYSGTKDDTIYLANLVIPRMLRFRGHGQ